MTLPLIIAILASVIAGAHDAQAQEKASESNQSRWRDPFRPVGWTPPKRRVATRRSGPVEEDTSPVKWEEAEKLLGVSGVSKNRDGEYAAIIRRIGVVENGDIISIRYGDLIYRWKVLAISRNGVTPERLGAYPEN